jgi:hypothetical protein
VTSDSRSFWAETTRVALRLPMIMLALALLPEPAFAHHGVASLGLAGLEGPGAPLETSNSATLPQNSVLAYLKLDYAAFETYTCARDGETAFNVFWMYGVGFGARSYLSLFAFAPFYTKRPEDNSYTTSGFADLSLMAVLGFRFDGRLALIPKNESLDDLEDLHFTLNGGATLPTGNANLRDSDGVTDPGRSLGFGKPSYAVGLSATKEYASRYTVCVDGSYLWFTENAYADHIRMRFGSETRFNAALSVRTLTREQPALRIDANLEANYLALGRDRADGVDELATGGRILYAVPGLRLFVKSSSVGLGVKVPVWTDLNEADEQQGAEGKERYRALFTFSTLL